MAMPGGSFDAHTAVGLREDLADVIYNIDPTETPFLMMCGRIRADAVYHEWQTDVLAVPGDNAVIEGDDATIDASIVTKRIGNRTQISDKVVSIAGTLDAVNKAGRKSELAYQLAKRSKELKRDLEHVLTRNFAIDAGSTGVARHLASLETWYETNVSQTGSSSTKDSEGEPTTTRTNGTPRAITEAMVKNVIQLTWTAGGEPNVIMCGPVNKQRISAFTGNATRFDRSEDKRLVAAIDIYVSDFGTHRIVPNRFSQDRSVFVLDPSLWSVAYLRAFRQWALAKTGDTDKRQIVVEYTLCSKNEAGSGAVFDLTV